MGKGKKVLIKDLQVGSQYWVVSGMYSFTVLEKLELGFTVKHVYGEILSD